MTATEQSLSDPIPPENLRFLIVLRLAGFLVFGYILLLSLSYAPSPYQPIVTLLVGVFLWLGAKNIAIFQDEYGAKRVLLGIVIAGGLIRFLWALFVPSLPVSDFQVFYENAIKLSQGAPVLSKFMGYNLLLSAGYSIFPGVLTGKIINAAAGTVSIWLLYLLGSRLVDPRTGVIAAFLLAILPSEINMVSVLGTEVIATTLGLAAAFFLSQVPYASFKDSLTRSLFAGLCFGLGLTVRSSMMFYLPVILLFVYWIASLLPGQKWKVVGTFLSGTVLGLGLIVTSYSLMTSTFSLNALKPQDTVVGFLTGTNTASSGTWNLEDNNLYYSWPAEERNQMVVQEALNRITSNPAQFLLLIPKKFAVLLASNDYGSGWSLYAVDWGEGNYWGIRAPQGDSLERYKSYRDGLITLNGLLSQAVYVFLWLFAFFTFLRFGEDSRYRSISLVVLAIVLFTLLPHIVLEVQSRYHHTVMPFIALLAACGIQQSITDADTRKIK